MRSTENFSRLDTLSHCLITYSLPVGNTSVTTSHADSIVLIKHLIGFR